MAGFFSLGGSPTNNNNNNNNNHPPPQDPNNEINPQPFYLYTNPTSRNQEIPHNNYPYYNKGTFELWQNPPPHPHHHQQQQQRQHPLMLQDLYSLAVGSSSRGGGSGSGGGGMNIYDDHSRSGREEGGGGGGGFMVMTTTSSSGGSGSGTISCQDCGNQAKKDCVHRRCRSCCKSRGFECPTHVKSTWVPAAKRRERQQQIVGVLQQQQQPVANNDDSDNRENCPQQIPKRVRDHTSSSFRLPSSNPSGSGSELANLPAEVNSTAVFRCVRVSSIDNTEDQFAYQTAVSIGGHTFKGILYDQGPAEAHDYVVAGDTSSGVSGGNIPAPPQLNLTTATSTSASSAGGTATAASQFLNTNTYHSSAAPHNYPFMAGTQFFHQQPPRN